MAEPGAVFACRVTPRAGREDISLKDGVVHIRVTTVPEDGKANKAVLKLLAKALGVPVSTLSVTRGHTSRDKTIRLGG